MHVVPRVHHDVKWIHERKFSDHTMVCVSSSIRPDICKSNQPISRNVLRLPRFKAAAALLSSVARLGSLSPPHRLFQHKAVIREAARNARGEQRLSAALDAGTLSDMCATISRCVWSDSVSLAKLFIGNYDIARIHLAVVQHRVVLARLADFTKEYGELKLSAAACRRARLDAQLLQKDAPAAQHRDARACRITMARHVALWFPFGKHVYLAGVLVGTNTQRGDLAKLTAFSNAWRPIFAGRRSVCSDPSDAED